MTPKRRAVDNYEPETVFETVVLGKLGNVEETVERLDKTNEKQWKKISKNANSVSWIKGGLTVVGVLTPIIVAAWLHFS